MTFPPFLWDLPFRDQASQAGSREARQLARVRECICRAYGPEHAVTAVWELPNGYLNLGTYVVEVSQMNHSGASSYHLVVQFGSSYDILRHKQPRKSLLSLDGFEVLVTYQEEIRGVTILPDKEQTTAFLVRYHRAIEHWIACCQENLNLSNPQDLLDLEILEAQR